MTKFKGKGKQITIKWIPKCHKLQKQKKAYTKFLKSRHEHQQHRDIVKKWYFFALIYETLRLQLGS